MFERFVFDGIASDEYGIICAAFSNAGLITPEAQKTDLKTKKSIRGSTFNIIAQDYSAPLTYTMQVINKDFSPISSIQERVIKKWLCQRNKYHWFSILEKRYADIWFNVNISNPKMIYYYDSIGMEFIITTDSPVGYSDLKKKTITLGANEITDFFYIENDEELPIYPILTITPSRSGTFTLKNLTLPDKDNTLTVKNCVAGEIITFECAVPYASSSISSHNIFNDFNKWWFYLVDGYNRITADQACTIRLEYREYRKVGIV